MSEQEIRELRDSYINGNLSYVKLQLNDSNDSVGDTAKFILSYIEAGYRDELALLVRRLES